MDIFYCDILGMVGGTLWTILFFLWIAIGFIQKKCQVPFVGVVFNLCWDCIYGFLFPGRHVFGPIIVKVWALCDVVIMFQYFYYLEWNRHEIRKNGSEKIVAKFLFYVVVSSVLIITFDIWIWENPANRDSFLQVWISVYSGLLVEGMSFYQMYDKRTKVFVSDIMTNAIRCIGSLCGALSWVLSVQHPNWFFVSVSILTFLFDLGSTIRVMGTYGL